MFLSFFFRHGAKVSGQVQYTRLIVDSEEKAWWNISTKACLDYTNQTDSFDLSQPIGKFSWYPKCLGPLSGLHKLWYPGIRDTSTWSKFGAHGEHGDVFLFSNLGTLWFSENLIRYSLHICLKEVKNNLFSFKNSYLLLFLVTILKILTYALVSTWSSVS